MRRPAASLSAGTSEQVRLILEAAESGAADMREDAGRQAKAHVARVEEAAEGMLAKLEQLQSELSTLLDGLRAGGERLTERPRGAAGAGRRPRPDARRRAGARAGGLRGGRSRAGARARTEPEPAPKPADDADEAGARIIALNMALGGSSREETASYLAENFSLSDPDALLDDVYAKVGK